ncbi:MAG: GldG family protein, partial [Bacteroidota bacterium]
QAVGEQYEFIPVDLSKNEAVPEDIATFLVISPDKKFSDSALYRIDQYLMRGGKLAFFLNRVSANLQARFGQPLDLGLDSLLAQYGVRVNADLIRDAQCANIQVQQQQGPFLMRSQLPFPYLPVASNFSSDNMMVKDLQSIVFHFVSSVDTSLASAQGVKSDVLIQSSKRAGRQTGFMMIDPFQQYTANDLPEADIPFAAIVEGSFKSYFAERFPDAIRQSPNTSILVVGDGDFMKDEYLGGAGNLTFFANALDYLADDTGLITIRSKNVNQPPLEEVSDEAKKLLKYGNLVAPPLLIVGYGIFRWRRRVAWKRAMETQT